MIEWTSKMATGHPAIDADHQKLISWLNTIEASLSQKQLLPGIHEMLGFLIQYSKDHFQNEEQYMRQVNCPSLAANSQAHQVFLLKITVWEFMLDQNPSKDLVTEIHRETSNWIVNHIIKIDCSLRGCGHINLKQRELYRSD